MNQVTNLKSLAFTWKKIANLLVIYSRFWRPYFCNRLFCGRRCCKTSICIIYCRNKWLTCINPMNSQPSHHLSYWGTVFLTLVEQMVAGFHPWLHYFFWGILTIHDSVFERDALATRCLYCLNKLTTWQVCVACLPLISLVSKSKQRAGKPHVARSRLSTNFLQTIFVLMKALFHKSVLLILNVSIVS